MLKSIPALRSALTGGALDVNERSLWRSCGDMRESKSELPKTASERAIIRLLLLLASRPSTMAAQEIKTMQLYNHLERFDKELVERGLGLEGPLDAEALSAIDSMHYHGVKAVDEASAELKLDASSKVLEIGSGLGGVVRRVASTTGCQACGLELQDDVSAAAAKLTARCGLGGADRRGDGGI